MAHREKRKRIPERDTERRAERAERRGFHEHETGDATPFEAQHTQERMLAAPARGLERLGGEHEKTAGEERHHRQHVQIHAVGTRWIPARLLQRFHRGREHPRRQQRLDAAHDRGALGALRQAHVEPIELAQPLEAPLCAGDVDQRCLAAQRHAG